MPKKHTPFNLLNLHKLFFGLTGDYRIVPFYSQRTNQIISIHITVLIIYILHIPSKKYPEYDATFLKQGLYIRIMDTTHSNVINNSDDELMLTVIDGNTKAFNALYGRYERAIFNFILRYTGNRGLAQDLLQETFTRIWFAAHSFDPEKGTFKTWLFKIALNITRSEMAKKQYSFSYLDVTEMNTSEKDLPVRYEPPDREMEDRELQKKIQTALSKLQPFLREIVLLRHYQQLKFSEIARITNTPEGTLKSRFHRAIHILKKHLNEMDMNYAAS